MTKPKKPVAPGEGERRAQRGYVPQYKSAAAAIYVALERDDLLWVGLADRGAGAADDVVLGLRSRVVGHQFKTSKYSQPFRLRTLLLGADGLLRPLASAWSRLRDSFPHDTVEIRLVTNDYPSNSDALIQGADGHSAAFLREFDLHPNRTLTEWRSSRWQPFVDMLAESSGLDDRAFDEFLIGLRIVFGAAADFVQAHRLSPEATRLAGEIASLLPRLVADVRDKDRWNRDELLEELGWRDSFALRRSHQFPVGAYVQRNVVTEHALRSAIEAADSGYVALVGPPGSGKSTLLQSSLATQPALVTVRYLAFVPGEGQGIGRGEAEDFLDDLNAQLKRSGLVGRFRDTTLHERREQFGNLLQLAGERFRTRGIRTLIVVDGLDHIPREERPERSLLAELPLPSSIPTGVLIVLGTQRLDLPDLKPAVQEQASLPERKIVVAPLPREAVYRMTDAFGLDPELRERVFDLCGGHPLVTRYLIEALRRTEARRREALLAGEITFEGDIETIYASAWREINDDADARDVMGYIARAEGPIQPELLAQAVSSEAVERALTSTRHLLSLEPKGWSIFHNSFRLFILSKPRFRFGKPDPEYSPTIYCRLAEIARQAGLDSPQRWLELRYLARAQEQERVLALAQPVRFRQQLADGRPAADIQADIRLAFDAAKNICDATIVFRLLLAHDEINRRATALGYAPSVVDALLAMGNVDGAQAYAEANNGGAYKLVDALLKVGKIDRARALFDRIEPLGQLLGDRTIDQSDQNELSQWGKRVFHFRDPDQIDEAIERLSQPGSAGQVHENDGSLGKHLRFVVAQAALAARPGSDVYTVARQLKVEEGDIPYLFIEAGMHAHEQGVKDLAYALISQAVIHTAFLNVQNGWRRSVALLAAELGDMAMARTIFVHLKPPAVGILDEKIGNDVPEGVARAVIDHAELATMLGEPLAEVAPSKRFVLRPLHHHASTVGVILGRIHAGDSISAGEVGRVTRDVLAYLDHAKAAGSDEFYAIHQIAAATPVLQRALVRAAALCGEAEFERVIAEFDRSFEKPDGWHRRHIKLRRDFVEEIYRWNGDTKDACRRLESLVSEIREDTPEAQVEELAELAATFARVGDASRARELLRRLHDESLGYALAPKKDPQYALWRELLKRANTADPERRRERVELMMHQLNGMMETEGRSSAYRIAAAVLTEAAMVDAATGLAAARTIAARAILSWDGIVNALLLGVIRRRSDLTSQCVMTWASLALPYYSEPYYSSDKLGEFISTAIAAARENEMATLVETLRTAIAAESKTRARAALLESLTDGARRRGIRSARLEEALIRWQAEAPVERDGSTPGRYDNVTSLCELEDRFRDENKEEPDYEGVAAYARLVVDANMDDARRLFERWPPIQTDSRARFALVERALSNREVAFARSLIEGYLQKSDEREAWSSWGGAGKRMYFQARLKLEGPPVHEEAYTDLVGDLAAGRDYLWSILLDFEDVFTTIAASPNWPAMWEYLAEQLRTTREHAIGESLKVPSKPATDEELIVALYRWALSLSLFELTKHVRIGALRLLSIQNGATLFALLARRLLEGEGDEPAEALQLLSYDVTNTSAATLGDAVTVLVEHPDYAVAVAAARLSQRWGRTVSVSHVDLPALYRLHLDGIGDDFERPTLADPISGAMRVEDPLGWTFAFSNVIKSLSRNGVSVAHIRYRCRMFIEEWGGLGIFGQSATDKLEAELRRLDMRMTYSRPHIVIAARAVRYVAGEMRRAGLLSRNDEPWLLHMMGYPAVRLPALSPAERPHFVRRPSFDSIGWKDEQQQWLKSVDDDVQPLLNGADTVIAEIARFIYRDIGREFKLERVRAPSLDVGSGDDCSSWIYEFPRAIWVERIIPLSDEPASTIVRRLSESDIPEVPNEVFVLCPLWLRRLSWRQHPENWLIYLDATGRVVANIVWWRDGGPVDIGEEVIWGEGAVVTVTPKGRAQIESVMGTLKVHAHARRTVNTDRGNSDMTERRASTVE